MNFKPCTEQKITDRKLWPKGVYAFEIMDAAEKLSQHGGNPMIELKVKIMRDDGASRVVPDYLLAKRADKLRNAAASCGLITKYETGVLSDDDFAGQRGRLKLTIEKGKNGYPDRNVIADYLVTLLPVT